MTAFPPPSAPVQVLEKCRHVRTSWRHRAKLSGPMRSQGLWVCRRWRRPFAQMQNPDRHQPETRVRILHKTFKRTRGKGVVSAFACRQFVSEARGNQVQAEEGYHLAAVTERAHRPIPICPISPSCSLCIYFSPQQHHCAIVGIPCPGVDGRRPQHGMHLARRTVGIACGKTRDGVKR